jgi:aspartyl-tRNA(Asn)/glutamyl-tRNA(Gln) amidotransferase subunit C
MKKQLSKKEVEHIAWLVHIELSESEKEIFTEQFNEILDYFKKIDAVDTRGVQPTYQILDLVNVYREDQVERSVSTETALRNAPKKEKTFFRASRIV